jgi:chromate reductase, NAD(P)H dehydrogenase (quinone)
VAVNILLVTGSTRGRSTNTAALRTAHAAPPDGVHTVLFEQLADLPAFNPDADAEHPHPAVAHLRASLDAADAVLFCTPEYAGTLPGSLKNLMDWTVGTGELYGKPVALLSVAAPGRGEGAEATLRVVLGYVDAKVLEDACARVFVHRDAVGPDGLIADPSTRAALADVLSRMATGFGSR